MGHFDIPFQDKNSERKMLYRRIERICRDIKTRIFDNSIRVTGFSFRDGQYRPDEIDQGEWRAFGDEEYWGYREQYCWFRQTVTLPAEFAGREVVYRITPKPDDDWRSSCFQFILFVNGTMTQGLDHNHPYAVLTECAKGEETFEIALNAYCDDNDFRGQGKLYAFLQTRDNIARDVYYDISVPLEAAHHYDADAIPRVDILRTLNTAVSMLELGSPDPDVMHESMRDVSAYLHENLYGVENPVTVAAIGHTHIDTAWRWRLRQTRDKAGRSFATVIRLMQEYPDYRFMSPQAQLYDFIREDYPELYTQIRERIRDGRWEAEGSMWVESDTNVISGESLVRQFLVGKRFFQKEFGVETHVMWLPDVFGYSAALPQIMKLAGIDYFMTTKISWSEIDRFPFDTFLWQGIDGTEVFAHFIPSLSAEDASDGFQTTYNTTLRPDYMINGWRRYANKDLNKSFLCSFGHGDGGGGPSRFMLENGKRMREGIPGCPQTEPIFAKEFFDKLYTQVQNDPRLPRWRGELYLEFHRGTLTSQARNKRYNRKSEILMHDCETLLSIAHHLTGSSYPADELLENWKLILLNQFHDIIPGSSIEPVYEDSKKQYEKVFCSGMHLLEEAKRSLAADMSLSEKSIVVFNTLGFRRTDIAEADIPNENIVPVDEFGSPLPCQRSFDGKLLFLTKDVPAKGYAAFSLREQQTSAQDSAVRIAERTVDTPFFHIRFDADYNICELIHKKSGRSVAPQGQLLNRLIAYEDRPNVYEAWDVKSYYNEKHQTIDAVESSEIVEHGALRTILRIVRPFQSSRITQDYIFYSSFDRIDVRYVIDWKEKHILLKADFPVDVNTTKATYDIQFGNLERSTHNNTTWDFSAFEVCGHRWADLSDNSFGLSVLNDCKYGWNIKEGHIMPSILRCAADPNPSQDREIHDVVFSIYPHSGAVHTSEVIQESAKLNVPLLSCYADQSSGSLPSDYGFVSCDQDNIVLETLKKAEEDDAVILRTFETWNSGTTCTLRFSESPRKAYITDLLERRDEELEISNCQITLKYRPFEIKSLKIYFS